MNLTEGTKIRITSSEDTEDTEFFAVGHIGIIDCFDGSDYWADFNNQGNSFVYDDGIWCIGDNTDQSPCRFEVIEGN